MRGTVTTRLTALESIVADLPLAAGCRERADVAVLGLRQLMPAAEQDFHAIVMLLAHCESQGLTALGFADDDVVEIDRYGDERYGDEPFAHEKESDEPELADNPDANGQSTETLESDLSAITAHRSLWDLLLQIHAASLQSGSPFMVDFAAPIPPNTEFVLDRARKRLLFGRAADNEQRLWAAIHARAARQRSPLSSVTGRILESLFPATEPGTTAAASRAEQLSTAQLIISAELSVLTGPPGTGKTFTLVRTALAWLCSEFERAGTTPGYEPRRIMLMAPTGRAASRMGELIGEALVKLESDTLAVAALGPHASDAIQALRSSKPSTIHAALGYSPVSGQSFRHDAGNPLDAGLVIVDETSMVGLELARRLLEALPSGSQICLVGDPGQLRAVEMGSVLFDLVSAAATDKTLHACHARLKVSRRFPPGSMIDRLARAINGDAGSESVESLTELLEGNETTFSELARDISGGDTDTNSGLGKVETRVRWLKVPENALAATARELVTLQAAALRDHAHDPDVAKTLKRVVVLAVHRRGPTGAHTLAAHAVQSLRGKKTTDPFSFPDGSSLIVTRNNKGLGLANGDLALVQAGPGGCTAVFPGGKAYDVRMLPAHSPAAALTVHKAQGSEWRHVIVVLPAKPTRLLTASLLYTACSRAIGSVTLVATTEMARSLASAITT